MAFSRTVTLPGRLRQAVRASSAVPPFNGPSVGIPMDVMAWYRNLSDGGRHAIDRWIINTTGITPTYVVRTHDRRPEQDPTPRRTAPLPICTRCGTEYHPEQGPCPGCIDGGAL